MRNLKQRNYLFAANTRKALKKIIDRISGFEMIKETLDWDPRPSKHGSAPQDLRIRIDYLLVQHD